MVNQKRQTDGRKTYTETNIKYRLDAVMAEQTSLEVGDEFDRLPFDLNKDSMPTAQDTVHFVSILPRNKLILHTYYSNSITHTRTQKGFNARG